MPTPPYSTTTHYGLGKWLDGDAPGAAALNLNWDTIDTKIYDAYQHAGTALTFSLPLKNTASVISLDYETNLKLSIGNKLDTVQDIKTTSTPQFARLGIGGVADAIIPLKVYGAAKITGDLTVDGNIYVGGVINQVNVADLNVADHAIRLNKGGDNTTALDGGIEMLGTSDAILGSILYDGTNWNFNLPIKTASITAASNLTLSPAGNIIVAAHLLPNLTDTYDLGSALKYWSNAYISQIQATIFAENTISAIGGYMMISKGQGTLPAVSSGTTQIDFGQTMTVNDFVLIKAKDTSGTYKTEYMQVLTLVAGTTYNVTRDVANAHVTDPAWADGTVYVILGQNGNGRLELNAYDTPRLSIIKQGAVYNAQTELIRLGDLNGFLGYNTETYGIAIGEATKYLKYDTINGLRIAGSVSITDGSAGGWTIDATKIYSANAHLNGSGYISFGATPPTSYGNNVGAWMGYTGGGTAKAQLSLYTSSSKYFQYDGTDFTLKGGTITGGIIQTATSGARAEMSATNGFRLYASNGSYTSLTQDVSTGFTASGAFTTGGNINSGGHVTATTDFTTTTGYFMGLNYYIVANGTLGTSYKFVDNNVNGSFNSLGISTTFAINSSGQIIKVNNIAATAKYTLIGDGTSFTPRLLAMSDLPALTANKVLLSDANGYVAASAIASSELFTPAYGDMKHNWATDNITFSASSTYYGWTGTLSGGHLKNVTFTDDNINGDYLTLANAGVYHVTYTINFYSTGTGADVGMTVFRNATEEQAYGITYIRDTGIYSVSGDGYITASAGDVIRLKVYSSNYTAVSAISIVGSQLNITKISN